MIEVITKIEGYKIWIINNTSWCSLENIEKVDEPVIEYKTEVKEVTNNDKIIKNEEMEMELEEPKTTAQKIARDEAVEDAVDEIVAKEKIQYKQATKMFQARAKEIVVCKKLVEEMQTKQDEVAKTMKFTKEEIKRLS